MHGIPSRSRSRATCSVGRPCRPAKNPTCNLGMGGPLQRSSSRSALQQASQGLSWVAFQLRLPRQASCLLVHPGEQLSSAWSGSLPWRSTVTMRALRRMRGRPTAHVDGSPLEQAVTMILDHYTVYDCAAQRVPQNTCTSLATTPHSRVLLICKTLQIIQGCA